MDKFYVKRAFVLNLQDCRDFRICQRHSPARSCNILSMRSFAFAWEYSIFLSSSFASRVIGKILLSSRKVNQKANPRFPVVEPVWLQKDGKAFLACKGTLMSPVTIAHGKIAKCRCVYMDACKLFSSGLPFKLQNLN